MDADHSKDLTEDNKIKLNKKATKRTLKAEDEEKSKRVAKSNNGEEKALLKYCQGVWNKSLFSSSVEKEINDLKLSADELLIISRMKLEKLISYQTNFEIEDKWEKIIPGYTRNNCYGGTTEDHYILEKYFQHQEDCLSSEICNIEGCKDITSLLNSWNICRTTRNKNCVVCRDLLEQYFWEEERNNFETLSNNNLRKIYLDFIGGLKKFDEIIQKDEVPCLFARSASYETISEKNDAIMKRILCIIHHENCAAMSPSQNCRLKFCDFLSNMESHVENCHSSCKTGYCLELKLAQHHWDQCLKKKNFKCNICGKFLTGYLEAAVKAEEYNKEVDKKLQNFNEQKPRTMSIADYPERLKYFFSNY